MAWAKYLDKYPVSLRLEVLRDLDNHPQSRVADWARSLGVAGQVIGGWKQSRHLYEELEAHPGQKRCGRCRQWLDFKHFSKAKQGLYHLNSYCRECDYKYKREWAKKDVARKRAGARKNHLRSSYGISPEDEAAMLTSQDNRCAICSVVFDNSKVPTRMCVDHCHGTGKVRGLLCDRCNRGIAALGDDPARMMAAAGYVIRHEPASGFLAARMTTV